MEEKIGPPKFPWKKGDNEEYSSFSVEVKVCQCRTGKVWSVHDWESPEDGEIASKLPTGGVEQVVFALFTEAVRREVFLEALIKENQTEGFLKKYLDEDTREEIKKELSETVLHVSKDLVERLVDGAVSEILAMLTSE